MCRLRTKRSAARLARPLAAAIALGTMLAGCSDMYFDRRDPVALGAGDAIAANEAMQTIDPWPPYSGNTNIAANGQRMQAAAERYRTDKVVPPVDPMAPSAPVIAAQSNSQTQASTANGPSGTSSTPSTNGMVTTPAPAASASQ
jgi:hypothetical protein